MKKYFYSLLLLPLIVCGLGGCEAEHISYSGPQYVAFSDSAALMPVFDKDTLFMVPVASTYACDYDRTFAVEVVETKSNAVEGVHYEIVEHNVTIKAGERAGEVAVRGLYDNIHPTDSLYFCLRLVEDPALKWDLYSQELHVNLVKCYPFDIEAFTGNIRMYATFPFSSDEIKTFLTKAEKKDAKTLILKEPFSSKYDVILKFNHSDPLRPIVEIPSQIGFVDANYGRVYIRSVETDPSVYDMPGRMMKLQMEFYLPGIGSFGVHRIALTWISQEEADFVENGIL